MIKQINRIQSEIPLIPDREKFKKREKIEQFNQALYRAVAFYCRSTHYHHIGYTTWDNCVSYGKEMVKNCDQIIRQNKNLKFGACLKGILFAPK